jgi:hypothetical protein
MNETIHLTKSNLPRMLGELTHSNQFLKLFSLITLFITIMALMVAFSSQNKVPLVVPLAQDGTEIERMNVFPKAEDQIEAATRRYLDLRYHWDPKNVQAKFQSAQKFILPSSMKAFLTSTAPIMKFSTEKQVSQKVYPDSNIHVDLNSKTISITGDRLTDIQGLKAVGNLKLTLFFENGPRTPENPWGVYIVKEKEE